MVRICMYKIKEDGNERVFFQILDLEQWVSLPDRSIFWCIVRFDHQMQPPLVTYVIEKKNRIRCQVPLLITSTNHSGPLHTALFLILPGFISSPRWGGQGHGGMHHITDVQAWLVSYRLMLNDINSFAADVEYSRHKKLSQSTVRNCFLQGLWCN